MGDKLCVIKRSGEVVEFDSDRIKNAIRKAVHSSGKEKEVPIELIEEVVTIVIKEVKDRFVEFFPNVENIQDIVEKNLVKKDLYEIAKNYILYRAKRQEEREAEKQKTLKKSVLGKLTVKKRDGRMAIFEVNKLRESIMNVLKGYEQDVSVDLIAKEAIKNIYDGIKSPEISKASILASISFIERDPAYSKIASRLFLQDMFKDLTGRSLQEDINGDLYREAFVSGIKKGVEEGILDKRLMEFDLNKISQGLKLERDDLLEHTSIDMLYQRYLIKIEGKRLELPQAFWMRVAMGLAVEEADKESWALSFYEVMSSLRYVPSTPTLFHSGLSHPQLSSCFLTTITDDLGHIFKCFGDNAQLAKWSGGLGNDWTNVRATGSFIKSTGIESQGVIPFMKIANDTNAAINRSGRKRGATCAYLETWHLDIEDFLDLRRNTGDERRRTHDMNTANWIPDLFMKRVIENGDWTLFSPEEVPDLHSIYGRVFETRYKNYEAMAREGKIKKFKTMPAVKLWRKMLSMLFETGHPWITFKDPCNIRSPQDHCGVIHSSNLCTEITLNTSEEETAVCNLGSVNLGNHIVNGKLSQDLLSDTIRVAVRALDNVIDINFYPTKEAKNSNIKHRPVGLGLMGFQDALFKLRIPFDSEEAIKFSDSSMEMVSYGAIMASSELAKERGKYESYQGSKWDRGIFPIDTVNLLEQERGVPVEVSRDSMLDWNSVREHVRQYGMRNSNVMAIAPTATISNLSGCFPCIEPIYKNIYVKSNMAGEFTIINKYLVEDLKIEGLWNKDMIDKLKYYDGNLKLIAEVPDNLKDLYKEAFEIDPEFAIKLGAARAKWIDQSQSFNVFMQGVSGKKLSDIYIKAWKSGLKTTYYLRSLAATQIEKSTLDASKFGYTQKRDYKEVEIVSESKLQPVEVKPVPASQVTNVCSLLDPDCEACQ